MHIDMSGLGHHFGVSDRFQHFRPIFYFCYEIEQDRNNDNETQYYPSKFLGFMTINGKAKVAVQSAKDPMHWEHLEKSCAWKARHEH